MSSQKTPTGSELNEVEQKKVTKKMISNFILAPYVENERFNEIRKNNIQEKNLLSSGTPTPKAGENGFELNESGTRFSFSKEASTQNPFPDGLPHADINGAIRSFDLEENDAIELKDAPKTASWRAKDGD